MKSTFEKTLESNLDSLESLKYSFGLELFFFFFKDRPDTFTDPPVRIYTKNEAVFSQDEMKTVVEEVLNLHNTTFEK